jgi:hypothetical protein
MQRSWGVGNKVYVTRTGRLRARYLPAVYFDSSVLIDYWMTEGLEVEYPDAPWLREPGHLIMVRELLKADRRLQKVIEIRKRLLFGEPKLSAVVSPLSLLELVGWNAEAAFRQIAAEATGARSLQRKNKKEIGDYLAKLLELRRAEIVKQKGSSSGFSTPLEILMDESWINRGFAEVHGLQGLLQADLVNFKITVDRIWQEPSAYAYLQVGMSDILHILIAQHLGCRYIASFDEDFRRVSDVVKEETQMEVLPTPESILAIL